MSEGALFVCATPIGNLADVSDHLRETLNQVDLVYAEDTRRAGKLLLHVGADAPVRSLFEGNEAERTEELVSRLRQGLQVALITDAGSPAVSDPGARAVSRAHEEGLTIRLVPGPSAVTSAVALSGFSGDRFVFEGFLPRRGDERARRLADISREERNVILFASPNRLADDLRDLLSELGPDRRILVAREMTKMHEELWRGSLGDAAISWSRPVKGEVTLVVEGSGPIEVTPAQAVELASALLDEGRSLSDAARTAAEETGVSRRRIYQELLDAQESS